MNTSAFSYELPKRLIAQYPLKQRDASRLLVLHRESGSLEHRIFSGIPEYFSSGDVLVANNTKVIPARIFGKKETGAKVEILLCRKLEEKCWLAAVKPARRLSVGHKIILDQNMQALILERGHEGLRKISFSTAVEPWISAKGHIPLPPYIERGDEESDRETYQTVYAKNEGAVAAPTAGLHFTPGLLEKIQSRGVQFCGLTLHVGLGTFRPVFTEKIEEHRVEPEWAELPAETSATIHQAKKQGKRIFAVGTTAVRTLEHFCRKGETFAGAGDIDLFIHPPYDFKITDALVTNFHLPCSSLLALVCAFGGYEQVMNAYQEAVRQEYRFYSYGDAMLIL